MIRGRLRHDAFELAWRSHTSADRPIHPYNTLVQKATFGGGSFSHVIAMYLKRLNMRHGVPRRDNHSWFQLFDVGPKRYTKSLLSPLRCKPGQ